MELEVLRFSSKSEDTLGSLFIRDTFYKWLCFTLEDEAREVKVLGETRIPAGRYKIEFKTSGGFHNRYLSQYGKAWHKGMLEVKNVPGFTDILIHKGNKEKHTAGCLLVGDVCHTNRKGKGEIQSSKLAYDYIYPIIRDILLKGEEVYITYRDFDSE